jgi:DNA-binding NarL/FixJ family response regulator
MQRVPAVEQVRIVIGAMPRLTREIIGVMLEQHSDMIIVAEAATPADVVAAAVRNHADAAIVGLPGAELPEHYASLLHQAPALRLLALEREGEHAFLFVLRPYRVALGEVSPGQLADAIRAPVPPALGCWLPLAEPRSDDGS